jgi:hypothetical protein
MVENYQANYLAKSPCNPTQEGQGLSAEERARFKLQERLQFPDTFRDASALLASAEARLSTFHLVGFLEEFDKTLVEISRKLDCPAVQMLSRDNVNPEPMSVDDLDDATLSRIRALTEVDQRLYDSAISAFKARSRSRICQ